MPALLSAHPPIVQLCTEILASFTWIWHRPLTVPGKTLSLPAELALLGFDPATCKWYKTDRKRRRTAFGAAAVQADVLGSLPPELREGLMAGLQTLVADRLCTTAECSHPVRRRRSVAAA